MSSGGDSSNRHEGGVDRADVTTDPVPPRRPPPEGGPGGRGTRAWGPSGGSGGAGTTPRGIPPFAESADRRRSQVHVSGPEDGSRQPRRVQDAELTEPGRDGPLDRPPG